MDQGSVASVNTVIHTSIERVWDALVDPEQIQHYMMGARVITDWTVGSPIIWKGEWKGRAFEDRGEVLAVKEPELLRYSHASGASPAETHIITIELKETAGVTHLRLTQDNNPTEEARKHAEENWNTMLEELKKFLGEAPVPPPAEART